MAGINVSYVSDSGCKDCKERKVGCHATCEQYLKWKEKDLERRKKIKNTRRNINIGYYHK